MISPIRHPTCHPQYVGFIAIMAGFLLQWPTIPTLVMFPVLVWMYVHLARKEEQEVRTELGAVYDEYAVRTPAFFPRFRGNERDSNTLTNEASKIRHVHP